MNGSKEEIKQTKAGEMIHDRLAFAAAKLRPKDGRSVGALGEEDPHGRRNMNQGFLYRIWNLFYNVAHAARALRAGHARALPARPCRELARAQLESS